MSIARASLVMIAALIASRVLGWLRLSVFGAAFGETAQLDAFWAAFRIPDALFNLVVAGALTSAFIPVFAGYLAKERENEAWHVASSVMNVLVVGLMVLSAVMWLAAPWIVPTFIVSPAFASRPGQLELTIELTRIMLLSPIFMGLSALVTGVLQSYRQFLAGAIAPLVYNGVQILFAIFAAPFLGIDALAFGVVAGAAMMFLVQLPELTFRRTKYQLTFDLSHPGVREIFLLAGPRTLALGAVQVVFFVDTYLASGMRRGIADGADVRVPADAAAPRRVLDRDLGRGVPRALALRVPRPGAEDARRAAAGDPLDPVPHASDRDPHGRAAASDREPALPVRGVRS